MPRRHCGHLGNHRARRRPDSGLWSQGVSGDLPIVLVRIADIENLDVVRELLQAHAYWRMKQLAVDLVILNERQSSYIQELQTSIETLVRANQARPRPDMEPAPGRVFVLRADLIAGETWALLMSVARVVLPAQRGGLFDQLERIVAPREAPRARRARRQSGASALASFGRGGARLIWNSSTDSAASPRTERICHRPRSRPIDAGAVDQRSLQSLFRLSGAEPRAAATPGRSTVARTRSRPGRTTP